jgi:integrase
MTGKFNLPYLWVVKGRGGRRYAFYRRDGVHLPINSPEGHRLSPGDDGFYEEYERIHVSFSGTKPDDDGPKPGTLSHVIASYRRSGDYLTNIGPVSRGNYDRYLDQLEKAHGKGLVARLPREAIYRLRDEHKETPSKANMFLQVVSILLNFAEERPLEFRLPMGWRNPARRIKKLKTGEGHRPWQEYEIKDFRRTWKIGTLERIIFELFLNTGQRGEDIAIMTRSRYFEGEISVRQEKTGKWVWIPASRELRDALDPWLESHEKKTILTTPTGLPYLSPGYMRIIMRDAMVKADIPDGCTLHGLRYTFATRAIEVGLDWQEIASIIGHETAEMQHKYTRQRRDARLVIGTMDRVLTKPNNLRYSRASERFGEDP